MEVGLPNRLRFGVFELDPKAGELRKGPHKVLLQEQPFQILLMLIERRGDVVTRHEIKKRLWPNDTVVEFDHSIHTAIKKLRQALGDSAEDPAYIETVARRGYRLIVPVEYESDSSSDPANEGGPPLSPQVPGAPSFRPPLAKGWEASTGLIGKKVSHYRVLEVIGGGGMGLVYKAEDLKLGRPVALKFLPEELASEPIALQRFEREARTASSLNHPNICSIYEFGEHEGQPFLVMELLEGETLRDFLAAADARPIALDRLLDIALQIAAGLEAAHEQGIIHRDIKPANIFLTKKHIAKILDFGLAKLMENPHPSTTGLGEAPTNDDHDLKEHDFSRAVQDSPLPPGRLHPATDLHLTRTGSAMGTAGYMSPEQVRGEKLDARTDLFSFGLILYEMATGQRAFTGETAAILKEAILHRTPAPVGGINSSAPPKLQQIIDKALEKDRERRYQSAAEVRTDLGHVRPLAQRKPTRRAWMLWAGAAIVLALAAGGVYRRLRPAVTLTDQDTVVLADFANNSGEPLFDDSLRTALNVSLQQTPFLDVLSGEKVRATLKLMKYPSSQLLTRSLALEVCRTTNSRALIAGSIADAGNHFHLQVEAVDCTTGRALANGQAEAENRNAVIGAVGQAATQLRGRLGEPLASMERFNRPVEEALSPSLQAVQAFTRANKADADPGDLVPLKQAVELDPKFASAYLALAQRYGDLLQANLAAEYGRKAYELRDRTTTRQRFALEVFYHLYVTGNFEQALRTWAEYFQIYPRAPASNSTSYMLRALGQHEKAAATAEAALQYFPSTANPAVNLMDAYMALDRPDQAKIVFDQARERDLDSRLLRYSRYLLAFMQHDDAAMQEQVTWGRGKPAIEGMLLSYQSNTEAYWGHVRKARLLSRQARDSALDAFPEATSGLIANEALREAEIGNTAEARALASEALSLSPGRNTQVIAALALGRAGDNAAAEKLADKLNQEGPLDTIIQGYWLPSIRATVALNRNQHQQALTMLQGAFKYELGSPIEFITHNGPMYPAYVRGRAHLKAGQAPQAIAEFQKMINHPGIMLNSVLGPLARLQLARAQVMMGDKAAARKAYQDFLTLWKEADPDIPIYRQAKAEYAKLR